jgi:hypothetical protein
MIVRRDWNGVAPEGVEVLRSTTNLAMIGGRTYCASAAGMVKIRVWTPPKAEKIVAKH